MIRFILKIDPLVLHNELVRVVDSRMMHPKRLGFGMRFHCIGFTFTTRRAGNNRNRTTWPDYILDEKCRLTDHWPPARLIPAHRSIIKADLQLAVIVVIWRYVVAEPRADGRHQYRLRGCHLAHHVDIMNTTVYNRTKALH